MYIYRILSENATKVINEIQLKLYHCGITSNVSTVIKITMTNTKD